MSEPSDEAWEMARYISGGAPPDTEEVARLLQELIDERDKWERWWKEAVAGYEAGKERIAELEARVRALESVRLPTFPASWSLCVVCGNTSLEGTRHIVHTETCALAIALDRLRAPGPTGRREGA